MRRRHRSLVAALASAPIPLSVAGFTFITGPTDSPPALGTRTDRPSASREVSPVPFSVRWSRRTVPSYHAWDHPASAFFRPRHPRQGVSSPMRFLAPRVSGAFIFALWRRRPRGSFVAGSLLGTRTRLAGSGSYRDLTGTVKVPVTLVGFTYRPSQFCSRPRVRTPLGARRTHLPFRHLPPRVSSSRGPPLTVDQGFVAAAPGVWPRANEPCRVIRRPRHGFYAQGRSNPPADTALGFSFLSRVFIAGLRSPPLEPFRPWAFRATQRRACRSHRCHATRALRRHGGPTTSRSGGVSVRIGVPV